MRQAENSNAMSQIPNQTELSATSILIKEKTKIQTQTVLNEHIYYSPPDCLISSFQHSTMGSV